MAVDAPFSPFVPAVSRSGIVFPVGVSAYQDRHGVTRYRYRKGGISIQLGTDPECPEFQRRLSCVINGADPKAQRLGRLRVPEGHLHSLVRSAYKRAKAKHLAFSITVTDLSRLFLEQNGRCALTNVQFAKRIAPGANRNPFAMSLDRIEPSKGYVPKNVRLVLLIANNAMGDWGSGPLLKMVRALVERS